MKLAKNNTTETRPTSQKLIINTLFNIFGSGLGLVITLLLTPFIISKLGLLQFGILAIINALIIHINLLDFGMKTSLVKHLAGAYQKKNFTNINKLINTSLFFCTLSALVVAMAGLMLAEPFLRLFKIAPHLLRETLIVFRLSIISFVIINIAAVFVAVQTGLQRMDIANKVKIFSSILDALGTVLFLQMGLGLKGLVFSKLLAGFGGCVLNVLKTLKVLPSFKLSFSFINKKTLSRLFNFGVKVQLAELSNVVRLYFGNFLVARYLGLELSGFYEIATKAVNQAATFPPMVISAVLPAVSELHTQKDRRKLYQLYWRGTKYLSLATIPLVMFVFVLTPLIIQAWLGPGFEKSALVLRLMILGLGLTLFTGLPTLFFQGMGQPKMVMSGAAVSLFLSLFLSFLFVLKLGFIGPALGGLIAVFLATAFYLGLFRRQTGWPFTLVLFRLIWPPFLVSLILLFLISVFNHFFWGFLPNRAWSVTMVGVEFLAVAGVNFLIAWQTGYLDQQDKKRFWHYLFFRPAKWLKNRSSFEREGLGRGPVERVCPSQLRGRIFYEHYRRYQFALGFVRGKRVLDAACGTGYGSKLLASQASQVTGVDYDLKTIRQCRKDYQKDNLFFVHGEVTHLDFPEHNFDVVVSFETLEHIKNFRKCLSEFKRVLKPGGLLLLSVPNAKFDDPESPYHLHRFDPQKLAKELTGFFARVKILGQHYGEGGKASLTERLPLVDKSLARSWYSFLGRVFFTFFPEALEKLRKHLYLKKMVIGKDNLDRAETFLAVCQN